MDRKKEEIEPILISSTTSATNILTTSNDDDTSTESVDTFDSWTLVTDKEKSKFHTNLDQDILKNSGNDEDDQKQEHANKTEQEPQLQDSLCDLANDDFSDGISIISESESVGRISPHSFVRDHLHDLNMKFSLSDHFDDTILNKMREEMENEAAPLLIKQIHEPTTTTSSNQQLRQRRRSSTEIASTDKRALQKVSQVVATSSFFVPLVKQGLQSIFYVGVGLALLGLIGKIINPTWQPLASVVNTSPSTLELEQKVNDIELQNNLMRAEIDLLNKQMKYLSSFNDPQQQQKSPKYKDYKETKTFKVWLGNGDSLKPVDITKQDLRKPYKCPDGSFVEIANMCMEQRSANEPSLVDQFGQVVEDLKEQSEAFKTFEQVAEELQGFQNNPFEQLQDVFNDQQNTETVKKEFIKNKPIYETPEDYNKENQPYQKQRPKGEEPNSTASHKHKKYDKVDDNHKTSKEYSNKKFFGKDADNRQSKEYKKYSNGNFRDNSQEGNEWKTDKFGNNSNERKYRKENSKERRYSKDFDNSKENSQENQSKERYNKQKRKYDKKNGHDDNDDSGEWQDKYMKHREQQRKRNEQKYQDTKNWYIKRGDSREYKRSGEKQYR